MRDILLQFNIEALVVCGIGTDRGGAGVGIGLAVQAIGMPVAFSPGPA